MSHSLIGMPQPFGYSFLKNCRIEMATMNKMMSRKNSSRTRFSSSSVTLVQTLANDKFSPSDSSELNEFCWLLFCSTGAGLSSYTFGGGADLWPLLLLLRLFTLSRYALASSSLSCYRILCLSFMRLFWLIYRYRSIASWAYLLPSSDSVKG